MALIDSGVYIWDFWYLYKKNERIFEVFFLNADRSFVKNKQQHFNSSIGRAKTIDWVDFIDLKKDFFSADKSSWDNTSIWTGDTVVIDDKTYLFYTSRDYKEKDGMVQHIGIATIHDEKIVRTGCKISAPPEFYLSESDKKESSIHCWRDPFVFYCNDEIYMLVAAKRKDFPINERGCIALMKLVDRNCISKWEHQRTLVSTNYSEVELPQIYKTESGGMRIFYNAKNRDKKEFFMMTNIFYELSCENIYAEKDVLSNIFEKKKYYGLRIVPEHNSIICAFNKKSGGVEVVSNINSIGIDGFLQMK